MTVGNSKSMSSKSLIPPIIPIIPRVLGNFQVQFHQETGAVWPIPDLSLF